MANSSLSEQDLQDIADRKRKSSDDSKLKKENTRLKNQIANQAKAKRGPSMANRIQGLQVLENTLGTQKFD